jgi:hypothetical protein
MPALAAAALITTATASQYQHRKRLEFEESRRDQPLQQPPIVSIDSTWGVVTCGAQRGANIININIVSNIYSNIESNIDSDMDRAWSLRSAGATSSSNIIAISTSTSKPTAATTSHCQH